MKHLIYILIILGFLSCSSDMANLTQTVSKQTSDKIDSLINNTDFFLAYTYDSLDNDVLYHMSQNHYTDSLKQMLKNGVKLHTPSSSSNPKYTLDLYQANNPIGEITVTNLTPPSIHIKSGELECSIQMDQSFHTFIEHLKPNIECTKTDNYLAFKKKTDSTRTSFMFHHSDSKEYSLLFIRNTNKDLTLSSSITDLHLFWNYAQLENGIKLKGISVPLVTRFSDITKRHIEAFIHSKAWQEYIKESPNTPNVELTTSIILEQDIYKPLHDFLKHKGYTITGLRLEKLEYMQASDLQNLGYYKDLIIPFSSVQINVAKVESK